MFILIDDLLFMTRVLCKQCQRPSIACICKFISKVDNLTTVLVLQHPSEVKQTKGTIALLSRSLSNCQVIVGEDFSQDDKVNTMLANHQALLLYPSAESTELSLTNNAFDGIYDKDEEKPHQPKLLIILDGTWKKAYRMFMLSSNLQALTQVCLPEVLANSGQYLIRKVAKKNALSSLEACCFALALIEGELADTELVEQKVIEKNSGDKESISMSRAVKCGLYQNLLDNFAQFNQFQLSFRPSI